MPCIFMKQIHTDIIYIYRYRNILIVLRSRNLQCFSQSLQDNVESFTAISFTIARTSPTASPFTSKKSRSTKKSTKAWPAFSSTGLTLTGQLPRQKCRCQWDGWNWKGYQNIPKSYFSRGLNGVGGAGCRKQLRLTMPILLNQFNFWMLSGECPMGFAPSTCQRIFLCHPYTINLDFFECCTEIMHSKQQRSFSNRINDILNMAMFCPKSSTETNPCLTVFCQMESPSLNHCHRNKSSVLVETPANVISLVSSLNGRILSEPTCQCKISRSENLTSHRVRASSETQQTLATNKS